MNSKELFENSFEEYFWEVLNNEDVKLRFNSKEWQEYNKICSEKIKNHKLQSVLEEDTAVELNIKDVEDLIAYHRADVERQILENNEMFKAGFRNAFYLFNKMELINDKNKDDLSA